MMKKQVKNFGEFVNESFMKEPNSSGTMMLSAVLDNKYVITGQLYIDTEEAPFMGEESYIDPYSAFDLTTKRSLSFEEIANEMGMSIRPGEDLESSRFWDMCTRELIKNNKDEMSEFSEFFGRK